jgi:large subunit ribosomal protein L10
MDEKFGISTKKIMLEEVKEKFHSSPDFVITNYKDLSALELEKLRRALTKASSSYFVVKNSVVKRAFDELKLKDFKQFISGEVGIGFTGDVLKASRALVDFMKGHKALKVNCAVIDGKPETADRIKYLAALPSRDRLLAMALTSIKSPITGFVGALKGLMRNFVGVLSEISKKKGGKNGGRKEG